MADAATEDRKAREIEASLDLVKGLAQDAKDLLVALLKAGTVNPLIGIAACAILVNVLERQGVIDQNTALGVWVAIGILDGSAVAKEADNIISGVTNVTSLFGSRAQPAPSDLAPVTTTMTFADGPTYVAEGNMDKALLGRVMGMGH